MGSSIRDLQPATAWQEGERRAFVTGVIGFLVAGALQSLGIISGFRDPLTAALSGLVALFLVHLTLFLAYYYHSWGTGLLGATASLLTPFVVNMAWVRVSNRSVFIPTIVVALCGYVILNLIHMKVSGQSLRAYSRDSARAFKAQFHFESRWGAIAFWAMMGVGVAATMWLLSLR